MKKIFLSIVALLGAVSFAQEKSIVDFSADFKSSHIWRGLVVSEKPILSASASVGLSQDGAFRLGTWGAFDMKQEGYKEVDLYLQYQKNGLRIGLWDIFNHANDKMNKGFWYYGAKDNGHLVDFQLAYTLPSAPLTFEWNTLLFGTADRALKEGATEAQQRYSTYVQLKYDINGGNGITLSPFVGTAFAFNGKTTLYGADKNFDLVNLGFSVSKSVEVAKCRIPLSVTTMWNPAQKIGKVQFAANIF